MLKRSLFIVASVLLAAPALAQHHDKHAGSGKVENLHAHCIGCHGIPGYKTAFPVTYHVPKIAGQQAGYIAAALKAYRSGQRSHPSMRDIARSMTDDDIEKLASYYAGTAAK